DPTQDQAAALMASALMSPPRETPPEVEAEIEALTQRERRLGVRFSLLSNLLWVAFVPLVFAMGLEAPWMAILCSSLLALLTACALWLLKSDRISARAG